MIYNTYNDLSDLYVLYILYCTELENNKNIIFTIWMIL